MKKILKLTIILSLFVQICHAQKVMTEEEYTVFNDSLISSLKIAEKDANSHIGKPLSELVKHFEKCGMKINRVSLSNTDSHKTFPKHVYGISVKFISNEMYNLVWSHHLITPTVYIDFEESKPYEKALSLSKDYNCTFTKEVEEFYSDAVVKSILFAFMDGKIYIPIAGKRLPLSKQEAIKLQERLYID